MARVVSLQPKTWNYFSLSKRETSMARKMPGRKGTVACSLGLRWSLLHVSNLHVIWEHSDSCSDHLPATATASAPSSAASEQPISPPNETVVLGTEAAPSAPDHGDPQSASSNITAVSVGHLNPYSSPGVFFPQTFGLSMAPDSNPALSNELPRQEGPRYDGSSLPQHPNTFPSTELSRQQVPTCDVSSLAQHVDRVPSNELVPQQVPIPGNASVAQCLLPVPSSDPVPQQVLWHDDSLVAQRPNPVPSTEPPQQQVSTHDNSFDWDYFLDNRVPIHGSPGLIFSSANATEGSSINPPLQANTQAQVPLPTGLVASDLAPNPAQARQSFRENRSLDRPRRSRSPEARAEVHNRLKRYYQQAVSRIQSLEHEKQDLQRSVYNNFTAFTNSDLQNFNLKLQLDAANRKLAAIEQELPEDGHQPICQPGQLLALAIRAILIDGGDAAQGSV